MNLFVFKAFIQHHWKSFWRNDFHRKNTIEKILVTITILFIWLQIILVACYLPLIINKISVNKPQSLVKYLYLTLLMSDLIIRVLFPKKDYSYYPYLILNIKKDQIVCFILSKQIFSLYNLFYLCLSMPLLINIFIKFPGYAPLAIFCAFLHPFILSPIVFILKNIISKFPVSFALTFLIFLSILIKRCREKLIVFSEKTVTLILNGDQGFNLIISTSIMIIVTTSIMMIKKYLFIEPAITKKNNKPYTNGLFR